MAFGGFMVNGGAHETYDPRNDETKILELEEYQQVQQKQQSRQNKKSSKPPLGLNLNQTYSPTSSHHMKVNMLTQTTSAGAMQINNKAGIKVSGANIPNMLSSLTSQQPAGLSLTESTKNFRSYGKMQSAKNMKEKKGIKKLIKLASSRDEII